MTDTDLIPYHIWINKSAEPNNIGNKLALLGCLIRIVSDNGETVSVEASGGVKGKIKKAYFLEAYKFFEESLEKAVHKVMNS